jgi:hypothetical protein
MPLVAGFRLDVVGSAVVLIAAATAWALRVQRGTPIVAEGRE